MKFKFRLRDLRRESGLTAEQLGALVGVSRFSISHFESGRNEPSLEVCHKFCEVFNCTMDYLLGFSDSRSSTDNFSKEEMAIICHFRNLSSDDEKKMVSRFIEFLDSKEN